MGAESGDPELVERLAELGWRGPGSPTPPITRLAAYGLVRQDDRVLLCRVASGHLGAGHWTLPGGGLAFGEAPEVAVVREIEEETGLRTRVIGPPEISSETGSWPLDGESIRFHQVRFVYPVEVVGGRERIEVNGSTDACGWFDKAEWSNMRLGGLARRILEGEADATDP